MVDYACENCGSHRVSVFWDVMGTRIDCHVCMTSEWLPNEDNDYDGESVEENEDDDDS